MYKRLIYGIITSLAVGYCMTTFAQTENNPSQTEEVDPYILCSKFPLNSVCQPYHLDPVALDDRSGEKVLGCQFKVAETEIEGPCKYSIESENFLVYLEEGQELESLAGEKPTRIISLSTNNIVKLLYEEDTIKNRPKLVKLIAPPPVRIASQVLKKSKKISIISVIFPGGENTTLQQAQKPQPTILTLVTEREAGGSVRSQLEDITGLPSEAPPTSR